MFNGYLSEKCSKPTSHFGNFPEKIDHSFRGGVEPPVTFCPEPEGLILKKMKIRTVSVMQLQIEAEGLDILTEMRTVSVTLLQIDREGLDFYKIFF